MNFPEKVKNKLKKGHHINIRKTLMSANGKYQLRINSNGGGYFMIRETTVGIL